MKQILPGELDRARKANTTNTGIGRLSGKKRGSDKRWSKAIQER